MNTPEAEGILVENFLPWQIPDARIMTSDYDAYIVFAQSTAEIVDLAKIMLAGLVNKKGEPEVDNTVLGLQGSFLARSMFATK